MEKESGKVNCQLADASVIEALLGELSYLPQPSIRANYIPTMVGHIYTDSGYKYSRFASLDLLYSPRTSKVVKI